MRIHRTKLPDGQLASSRPGQRNVSLISINKDIRRSDLDAVELAVWEFALMDTHTRQARFLRPRSLPGVPEREKHSEALSGRGMRLT